MVHGLGNFSFWCPNQLHSWRPAMGKPQSWHHNRLMTAMESGGQPVKLQSELRFVAFHK